MARMFADLHLHPTLFGFNRLRNGPDESNPDRFNPWNTPPSDAKDMSKGRRAATYSQADMAKMTLGKLRISFASITPIEVGFFKPSLDTQTTTGDFARSAIEFATGATAVRSVLALIRQGRWAALREATGLIRNEGPVRLLVERIFLRYSAERLRFMASPEYDYWEEFLKEYDYLASRDGQTARATVEHPLPDGTIENLEAEGSYHLIRNPEHLRSVVEDPNGGIAVILTIEGGHAFSIGPDHTRVDDETLWSRIDALKALPSPLLFLTLAHHFDNGICGHAHSAPDIAGLVFDQTRRMDKGFEPKDDLGFRVARKLLALDDDLNDLDERRILLDVKHMSPLTRQQYYRQLIEPYNAQVAAGNRARPRIPVIMSHGAYSGVQTLDDFINDSANEDDDWCIGAFRAWGLNACDEDVRAIHASKGLLGIVFEQRVLGARSATPLKLLHTVALTHMAAIVDVIMLDDRLNDEEKRTVWDCVCLGTDYDGLIDPLATYPTALELPRFEEDLRGWLERNAHTRQIAEIGVDELVEKICWRNAYDLALRHMPS